MVSSAELIGVIAEKLHTYGAKHIVVDPVMVATSGSKLLRDDAVQALTEKLLPMAEVVTPNIPETEILSGMKITDAAGMETAAKLISEKYHCAVLCKGGHQINDATTFCGGTAAANGSAASALQTPIPTAPAAPYPAPLRLIWQRAMIWMHRWSAQRPTFPAVFLPCWIWATAPARWTICLH